MAIVLAFIVSRKVVHHVLDSDGAPARVGPVINTPFRAESDLCFSVRSSSSQTSAKEKGYAFQHEEMRIIGLAAFLEYNEAGHGQYIK